MSGLNWVAKANIGSKNCPGVESVAIAGTYVSIHAITDIKGKKSY